MSPVAIEESRKIWSPYDYDYDLDSWIEGQGSMLMGGMSVDPRNAAHSIIPYDAVYGDYDLGNHLHDALHNFSIKRCQGFSRCDMDIDAEVIGWVIGKNGSTIKELKNKTGCNMWVDQRALKLTITGPDSQTVEHAAKSVEAYVAAAPIKAGAVEEAETRYLECPPHLLDVLGERSTIARIVKETRAQVVVNKKMARVIVRGGPHAVQLACSRLQATIDSAIAMQTRKSFLSNHNICLEPGIIDGEYEGPLINSTKSCAASGIHSPYESLPVSPSTSRGQIWSLFSGPETFKTSDPSLKPTSSETSLQKVASPTSSFFTSANYEDEVVADNRTKSAYDTFSTLNNSKANISQNTPYLYQAATKNIVSVATLLNNLKLDKYQSVFEDSEIDIEAVRLMNESDFSELGIPKGPRLKIMNAIKALNKSS